MTVGAGVVHRASGRILHGFVPAAFAGRQFL
jgi:hypothetical protein